MVDRLAAPSARALARGQFALRSWFVFVFAAAISALFATLVTAVAALVMAVLIGLVAWLGWDRALRFVVLATFVGNLLAVCMLLATALAR